jgi:hypothetical protein
VSYAVFVHAYGDPAGHYVTNALRFTTSEEARVYGDDLAMRWTQVEDWRVEESPDAPTYTLDLATGERARIEPMEATNA